MKIISIFTILFVLTSCSTKELEENVDIDITCNVVYLDDNMYTIKACPNAQVGDSVKIDDIYYVVVSEIQLRQYINDGFPELNRLVTTRVRDMSKLFYNRGGFNQDISNWDVSNVKNMREMFYNTAFNRPIEIWDVRNVENMRLMFAKARRFNTDISSWDVSNVTDMYGMFWETPFNQDLSSWNVLNVKNMGVMFSNSQMNQNLENWSVSQVDNCAFFDHFTPQWTLPKPNFTNCSF